MASEQDVIASIPSEVAKIRERYEKQRPSLAWRKEQLGQLRKLIVENQKQICEALNKDLGILPELANVNEVGATIQEIDLALANIDTWVKPESKSIPLMMKPGSGHIHKEPFGVVLIISPWNYPFRLLTFPLVGAIAAGNAVVMKPSEVSAHTSALIKRLFDKYLCKSYIATFEGGVAVSSALLSQRFDFIFYTGNTEVGKIVMKAASENLTPVTLELGGKSPVIVDKTANLDVATNRILYGKFTNAGQTCVAPDYLLVEKSIKEPLIDMLKAKLKKWYTEDPEKSESYSRVINERHTARLQGYLDEVRNNIVFGGKADIPNRFMEPTIVDEPSLNSKLMKDEIFGPILPVMGVNNVKEAIQFVNSRHKPLALYVFSQDKAAQDYVINNTSSGGVCLNATIFQIACPEMEFGGVGHSGMGQYNGKHTFDTFSHRRAVLSKATWVDPKLLYPPYTPDKRKVLQNAAGGIKIPKGLVLGAGAAVAAGAFYGLSKL